MTITAGKMPTITELPPMVNERIAEFKLLRSLKQATEWLNKKTLRPVAVKIPMTETTTGTLNDICQDDSYVYICIATDTWIKIAITVW